MPLAVSRPWKHPSRGVYWLLKGVPEDLRKLVGKREEQRSRQTRDPVEAKRRHAEALAEIEGAELFCFLPGQEKSCPDRPKPGANWALSWRELIYSSSLCNQTVPPHIAVVFGKIRRSRANSKTNCGEMLHAISRVLRFPGSRRQDQPPERQAPPWAI
jgi:hypothetical protein